MASHVSQGMARPNACVTHGKPCVHMHANGHAYKWGVHNHFVEERAGKEKRKGEKERKGKEKRKRKKKEKKGKGKEREKKEGGRWFLPQFIGVPTVGTR